MSGRLDLGGLSDNDASRGPSLIVRAFQTLELLAGQPRSGAEVARHFGIDPSTALRLLRELETTGYVSRDERTKKYTVVGARFYRLIAQTPDHADLSEVVDPILRSLRDEFGETSILAVPAQGSMIYAAIFPSAHLLGVRERLGTIRPIHCSAVGKAYLLGLGENALREQVDRLTFAGGTEGAARDIPSLLNRLTAARAQGYALDRNETFAGLSCVAAPLWLNESLIGSVGVSGPSSRLTRDLLTRIGRSLREAVNELQTESSGRAVSS